MLQKSNNYPKTRKPRGKLIYRDGIDRNEKGISLKEILENMELTRSQTKTAKILGCGIQNINQRLAAAGIDMDRYRDFRDVKPIRYEVMQARLIDSIDNAQIQKAPLGSKILAVCQLEDKIRLLRGESTGHLTIHADIQAIRELQAGEDKPLISLNTVVNEAITGHRQGIPQDTVSGDVDACNRPVIDL